MLEAHRHGTGRAFIRGCDGCRAAVRNRRTDPELRSRENAAAKQYRSRPDVQARYAADMRRRRAAEPERFKAIEARSQRKRRYGLSEEDWQRMRAEQGDACAICREVTALVVDHDHACCPGKFTCGRCVRALLCSPCNTALGGFRDAPDLLRAAADYLDQHTGR